MNKELYDSIESGYYFRILKEGNFIQRYWHRKKFKKIAELIKPGNSVLDVGCGPGSFFYFLKNDGGKNVGLDLAYNQIKFARENVGNGVYICGGAPNLPFKDESFDYIVLSEVIEHLDRKEGIKLLKQIYRVLKKGGAFIMTTPNYGFSLWPIIEAVWNKVGEIDYSEQHINKFNISRLKGIVKGAGFSKVRVRTFLVLSAFVAFLPKFIVGMIAKIEEFIFRRNGSLILLKAWKI